MRYNEVTLLNAGCIGEYVDAIREIVSGKALSSVIRLPDWLRDGQVEVIVLPASDRAIGIPAPSVPKVSRRELDNMKKGSVTEKLTGAINHPPVTIAEIREERLAERYGRTD
jgi:hypothetical protein